jgi:hypothetical protein
VCVCSRICVCALDLNKIVLQVGDTILKVDHKEVDMDSYEMALLVHILKSVSLLLNLLYGRTIALTFENFRKGCDVPGSKVQLTIRKPEVCRSITLTHVRTHAHTHLHSTSVFVIRSRSFICAPFSLSRAHSLRQDYAMAKRCK